jgi:hypothetical protein
MLAILVNARRSFHDFEHHAPFELIAGSAQEGSHRTSSSALFPDDLAEISICDAQLYDGRLLAFHLAHSNLVRVIYQRTSDELNKLLHIPETEQKSSRRLHICRSRDGRGSSQQAANGLGRLGAARDPVVDALPVENNLNRLPAWVVMTHDLDEAAIALGFLLGHYDTIYGLLFRPFSGQSDC